MSEETNLASGSDNSQRIKKVLESVRDKDMKERLAEILKNHNKEAYLRRLAKIGVVVKSK